MLNILKLLKIIINHPLNVNNKFESLLRFFSFNLKKILKKKIIFSWVEESKLIYDNTKIEKLSQRQIKLNYYLGMAEYKDMIFLIHCLKKDDIFIDCGANLGLYTILASKVIGSDTIAFEPHPETVKKFVSLLNINNITSKVKIIPKAIGDKIDKANFSNRKDALRRKIIQEKDYEKDNVKQVEMTTLDYELKDIRKDFIIKMDLEGFEYNALKGALSILQYKNLKAIIIEINKDKHNSINQLLYTFNFFPIEYYPKKRQIKISEENSENKLNLIFIRDFEKIESNCISSQSFKINPVNVKI
jgi:FkbM family methyltransferase